EAARAALPERFAIAALDLPPDRPRHLLHARRSGVVTELEAAAILRAWLDQLDVPAEIRLMCDGPAPAVTPIGCAHAVLEVTLDGAPLTLDPACPTCPPGAQREGLTPL
ncbi:MAG TPA: hypothetical protein PKA64_05490, partial [Myxococcota bacterium]|nr:hypothetical protein [Myxococcota bacterium]